MLVMLMRKLGRIVLYLLTATAKSDMKMARKFEMALDDTQLVDVLYVKDSRVSNGGALP